jgi:hypothetical protein
MGAVEVKEKIWANSAAQLKLTYLPDPASRGALLPGLPGLGADEIAEPTPAKIVNKVPFHGAWPDASPFRLRLAAIPMGAVPAKPKWDDVERVLTLTTRIGSAAATLVATRLQAIDRVLGWI